MSVETVEPTDLLGNYIARDTDSDSPWFEFALRTGDRHLLGVRDLLSIQLAGADVLLIFTRFRVRVKGFQLAELYERLARLTCRRLAESKDPATVFDQTPGAITKIEVESL